MQAVTAQLVILNKEIEGLDNKIEALYAEKKTAKEEDRAELQERITKKEAEKEEVCKLLCRSTCNLQLLTAFNF